MAVALGIDFEDIIHTPAYRGLDDPGETSVCLRRATTKLLNLFDRYGASATFFIVAEVVENQPAVVRQIADRGHEIASHTVSHCSLVDVDRVTRTNEIFRSKCLLEDATGQRVRGFRAPTCRINDVVYQELTAAGYEYSSSVMPSIPIPGFYSNEYPFSEPTKVTTPAGNITEIPLSVHPILRLPLSGAWLRLLGQTYALQGIRSTLRADRHVVTYSHPWEFESLWKTPLPFRSRVRTGDWIVDTYESILALNAEFCTVADLVERTTPTAEYAVSAHRTATRGSRGQ